MDTEEKIKEAARKVFRVKGYAGTRTRDIAEEAGVNPALLNYYFRSKDGLFKEVMKEIILDFLSTARPILVDKSRNFKEAVTEFLNKVIDLYLQEPDLVIFIINEFRTVPRQVLRELNAEEIVKGTFIYETIMKNYGDESQRMILKHGITLITGCMSFILFPFICRPIFTNLAGVTDDEFREMIDERKRMIPAWLDFLIEQYHIKL